LNCNSARYKRVFNGSGQLGREKTLGKLFMVATTIFGNFDYLDF
jgi:hypothetical protein